MKYQIQGRKEGQLSANHKTALNVILHNCTKTRNYFLTIHRTHGASGKHLSEGERSMLAMFKESAMEYKECEAGTILLYIGRVGNPIFYLPVDGKEPLECWKVDADNIIPITDEEYFADDVVNRFVEFVKAAYEEETLKVYQKRPIYWLFDSGKQNG